MPKQSKFQHAVDTSLSSFGGLLIILYDIIFLVQSYGKTGNDFKLVLITVFLNLVLLIIITLPFIAKSLDRLSNTKIAEFLELPSNETPLRYSVISSFVSNQALGSFLASLLIFTAKTTMQMWGPVLAGIFVAILFIFAITLITISYISFVMYFTNRGLLVYFLVSSVSFGMLVLFFHVGLSLAT